jgi:transposase-like protein
MRERRPDELVDELLAGAKTEEEIVGPGGLLSQLTKRLLERAMEVELTGHLGYEPHQEPPGGVGNIRNGSTPKTLTTEHGPVEIRTPRDRQGWFEPKIVRKRQRRFERTRAGLARWPTRARDLRRAGSYFFGFLTTKLSVIVLERRPAVSRATTVIV